MRIRIFLFYFLQSIFKYLPFKIIAKLRAIVFRPFFKKIGKNVVIHDNVIFKFPEYISIGDNVQIAPGCVIVGGAALNIGSDVLLGSGTKITTSSHNHSRIDVPMRIQGLSFSPITIEDDVWFGFNCVVLGGTIIKKGCIIGANSVLVGKTFDEFSIIVGVPGQTKKKRIK